MTIACAVNRAGGIVAGAVVYCFFNVLAAERDTVAIIAGITVVRAVFFGMINILI